MTSFSDLNLDPKVLKAIEATGYTTPTPIQAGAIPPALEGRDVLGIAQTGTGKTASFTLPMITRLGKGRARARMPRSLVLAPTRELAAQVAENFDNYAKGSRLKKALLIGGVSFKEQDMLIDRGVDVLIATPGRLIDHFERGKLLLTGVEIMVVDEADRMLDMGFIPDIERIFEMTPFTRQTLFFSATMAPEIERITNKFLSNPVKIEVERQNSTSETITQILVEHTPKAKSMAAKDKREILRAIIERDSAKADDPLRNAIIFCNRKVEVDVVAKSLKKHGYNAEPIHGDLEQSHRTRTLDGFRDGSLKFLVASDVAARGLDIPNVSHVFNFDVPSHAEDYVHRIGRTGRAGKLGTAYTLATPADGKYLDAIRSLVKADIPKGENPWTPPGGGNAAPATREEEDDKPRRTSSRTRSRSKPKSEDAPPVEAPAQVAAVEVRHEPAPQPQQRNDTQQNRNRSRGGRGRNDRDSGPRVVGLGDHVPTFIELSFDERRDEA
ncbi:DEAD/DEAH box helicase [Jannaschia pohangensis]|uniref:DEAD-box ATP-dependent RNA helicase RhpA n=1 Tax=Jannaschia pohangensis TaxID=390807 RepID=A0A1I3NBA0_9RHOB|nr:DEAD/DEAH box helicase [Jannaschia pohangensis]SFJ06598.1 Superfamily II DNA and RNA helicase [Jannaschia pohangensis]